MSNILATAIVGALGTIGVSYIDRVMQNLRNGTVNGDSIASKSLIEFTKPAMVEPICMVEESLTVHEITNDLQLNVLHQFCGFYLQAFTLDATVSNVSVRRVLDKLNPNRNPKDSILDGTLRALGLGTESIVSNPRLPTVYSGESYRALSKEQAIYNYKEIKATEQGIISLENNDDNKTNARVTRTGKSGVPVHVHVNNQIDSGNNKKKNSEGLSVENAIRSLREETNLSIGRLLNVTIERNGQKAEVPVQVRLGTLSLPASYLAGFMVSKNEDWSISNRLRLLRSGRIEFFRDFLLWRDYMMARRKQLYRQDKTGLMIENEARALKNKIAGVLSVNPSLNTMSNIMIVSKTTLDQAIVESNKDFRKNYIAREKMFDNMKLMMLVEVDMNYNTVTFYYQSVERPSTFTFNQVKMTKSSKGDDIKSMLELFRMGQGPTF